MREMLFTWLSKYIKNSDCLDCFAGSGALGIESISRFANFATLLENNKKTFLNIKKNIKKLNIYNVNVINKNVLTWLNQTGKPYDIIFLDPPYYQNLIEKTIFLLKKNKWIKKNTLIYVEQEKKKIIIPENWTLYKKKMTKTKEYLLYFVKK